MSNPISISQLIEAIGDDNLSMQPLAPSFIGAKRKKAYNEMTFATEVGFGMQGPEKLGIILWVSKEDFARAKEKLGV